MTEQERIRYEKLATDDVRIREIKPLITPVVLLERIKESASTTQNILETRAAIHRILHHADDRLLVVVGPCSIHDTQAGMEYARRLLEIRKQLSADLLIVMRVYFEKPRTTVGWKGLINDPHLDGTYDINEGLARARKFLLDVNEIGMPAGAEFLDTITPQYTADLVVALRCVQHVVQVAHRGGDAHGTDVRRSFVGPERELHRVQAAASSSRRCSGRVNSAARSAACSKPWIGVKTSSIDHLVAKPSASSGLASPSPQTTRSGLALRQRSSCRSTSWPSDSRVPAGNQASSSAMWTRCR